MKTLKHFLTTQHFILSKTSKYKYQYEMKNTYFDCKGTKKIQTNKLFV